jgi:hypothetical protein
LASISFYQQSPRQPAPNRKANMVVLAGDRIFSSTPPLLFLLSSARVMSAPHWPLFWRSQNSVFCLGVNHVGACHSIRIPPHLARLECVASIG